MCNSSYKGMLNIMLGFIISILSLPRIINFKFPLQSHQKYNVTSHSMKKNLAFQMKADYAVPFLTHYQYTLFFSFFLVWRMSFLNLGVKGIKAGITLCNTQAATIL